MKVECEWCGYIFQSGDDAYVIGIKRIHVIGGRVETLNLDVYRCRRCTEKENEQ